MDKGQGGMNSFQKDGIFIVRDAIDSNVRDFVTQYALFDEMQDYSPDGIQVKEAHSKYADPAMESILLYLLPLMEKSTGLSLYPTYSYYRVYRNGDELLPHTDRESCEISATLCFNFDYKTSKNPWPIFIENTKIDLYPGDLAIYKGIEQTHWREKLSCDEEGWHVQAFLHYVNANGPYSAWKFDKRNSIGEKK